jgi:hypothetical protein
MSDIIFCNPFFIRLVFHLTSLEIRNVQNAILNTKNI